MIQSNSANVDPETIEGFGDEWTAFDQSRIGLVEQRRMFDRYFRIFPLTELSGAEGFDLGCGSGRWAALVAPHVGKLHCIDPANKALDVSRQRLEAVNNVEFHLAAAHEIPLAEGSQDFGYSLGVLHHVPDTELAMSHCVGKLKPGAPFLVYLYYKLESRAGWYRALWHASEMGRKVISRLPFPLRRAVSEIIAATVYLPLSGAARLADHAGADVSAWPLSDYRTLSYYTMRTDALDRFGTRLERRFSRDEIRSMMDRCGLTEIQFSDEPPFWVAVGRKRV